MIKAKKLKFLYLIYAFTFFMISFSLKASVAKNISLACCIYENEIMVDSESPKDALKLTCQNSLRTLVDNKNFEQENLYQSVKKALGSGGEKPERDLFNALEGSYSLKSKSFSENYKGLNLAYEAKYGRSCEMKEDSDFKVFTTSSKSHGSKHHKKYSHKKKKKKKKKDNEPDAISFGILAGINITNYNLSGSSRSYDPKSVVGFQAGLTIMWFFSDSFGVGTGAIYQNRGVEFYDGNYDLATRDYHFLEVPLTFGYDMHHIVKIYAGAQFSMFLSGTRKSRTLGTTTVNSNEMNTLTMGATVGALFHITSDLFFDLSYVHGIQDEVKNITNQRRSVQLGLAYYF